MAMEVIGSGEFDVEEETETVSGALTCPVACIERQAITEVWYRRDRSTRENSPRTPRGLSAPRKQALVTR